jgi:predicted alpha/beta-hydrolase family hydrolase
MRFLGFSNHGKGALRQEISKLSTVCSTFSRSGWSVVRSASLAKGGTSKKRPSPHLHQVPTRSNNVSPRTFKRHSQISLMSNDLSI